MKLWEAGLPASAQAPRYLGSTLDDYVIAFALPPNIQNQEEDHR